MKNIFTLFFLLIVTNAYGGFTPQSIGSPNLTTGNLSTTSEVQNISGHPNNNNYKLYVYINASNLKKYDVTITLYKNGVGKILSNPTGSCTDQVAAPTNFLEIGNLWNDNTANGSYYLTVSTCRGTCSLTNGLCSGAVANLYGWSIAATTIQPEVLTINKSGTGTGSVTPDSGTINWSGLTGTGTYNYGTQVILTAIPDLGKIFTGWSGACNGTGSTCSVTMTGNKSVTATFIQPEVLTINKSGTGTGSVTPDSGTINWSGLTGTGTYNYGTQVILTAIPDPGKIFTGWSGACTGLGPCTITMDGDKSATATFTNTDISPILNLILNDN